MHFHECSSEVESRVVCCVCERALFLSVLYDSYSTTRTIGLFGIMKFMFFEIQVTVEKSLAEQLLLCGAMFLVCMCVYVFTVCVSVSTRVRCNSLCVF